MILLVLDSSRPKARCCWPETGAPGGALARRAGWDVRDPPPRSAAAFRSLVSRETFQIIGVSAATTRLGAIADSTRISGAARAMAAPE